MNSNIVIKNVRYHLIMQLFTGSLSIRSLSNITSPPTIITHPASQLVTVRMTFTLNCEATGEGSITYQWETRNINGGQWVDSSNNSSTLVVSNLRDPQQYRCIVSNEVGSTVSNVATITVLSKYTKFGYN